MMQTSKISEKSVGGCTSYDVITRAFNPGIGIPGSRDYKNPESRDWTSGIPGFLIFIFFRCRAGLNAIRMEHLISRRYAEEMYGC